MKKNIFKKILAIEIILLFIVGAIPSIIEVTANSNLWNTTEVVSSESNLDSMHSCIVVDDSGTIHVIWGDYTNYGGSGSDRDIFYKYKSYNSDWSSVEVVSTESTGDSNLGYEHCLAVDSSGTLHVVWEDNTNYNGAGTDRDVFYKNKPMGGSWMTTELVSIESTGEYMEPALAIGPNDSVHVVWSDNTNFNGCGSDRDIFYKARSSDGIWSPTEVVSIESNSDSGWPSIDVGYDGAIHVSWLRGAGAGSGVFYKEKSIDNTWSPVEIISSESNSNSGYPTLDVDNGGNIHVAWYDNSNYLGSGSDFDIFYKMKPSGGTWTLTEVV
jgi:hypothetical protein